MPSAQLIHRGEQFQFVEGNRRYEGTCLWSWQDVPGGTPRSVSPVYIYARSIRRTGIAWFVPLAIGKRVAIARQAKSLLEARDPDLQFVVAEDLAPGSAQKSRQ